MALLAILVFQGCNSQGIGWLEKNLQHEMATHTDMQADDIYKFIYLGTIGPHSASITYETSLKWLHKEVQDLADSLSSASPVAEQLSPEIVRINLSPYMKAGGSLEKLASAFVDSKPGDLNARKKVFAQRWKQAKKLAASGKLHPFTLADLETLEEMLDGRNWPAIHHSQPYVQANNPHYRVLKTDRAKQLLVSQGISSSIP